MDYDVTVVIPTHTARIKNGMTRRAIGSVLGQSMPVDTIIVERDIYGDGAAVVRNRGLQKVQTTWTAFLDSDDQFKANHIQTLLKGAEDNHADYVYSWFVPNGFVADPLGHMGKPFDPENPHQTTITTLVRTELAQTAGFHDVEPGKTINGEKFGEDFQFTLDMIKLGAKIVHIPAQTWIWNYHGGNTSGEPGKGDDK